LNFLAISVGISPDKGPERQTPTAFVAAGFLFAPSDIIEDVPYDPHIYFQGEEITLAVRLWTHGWDLFTPNRHVIYHDYTQRRREKRHWDDQTNWSALNRLSEWRVRHLLSGASVAAEKEFDGALVDLDEYGLGDSRTLADYEAFAGVRFADCEVVADHRLESTEPKISAQSEIRAQTFTGIWQRRDWANTETVSGGGATLAETRAIRDALPGVFREFEIEVLGDAGCGEFNWMSHIVEDLRLYLGFDIVSDLLKEVRDRHGSRKNLFFSQADIVDDVLPKCDAILCRDCLTHMTHEEACAALSSMKRSGSTFLIGTTHLNGRNKAPKQVGWHPMDLMAAPFRLPDPVKIIEESLAGTRKSLGVWRLADLPDF
jgi:hypothetical protein